jgi:multidrug efflux system outer membrane protein
MSPPRITETVHGSANLSFRHATRTKLSGVTAAVLLAGCTSFIPDYQRPAAPVAPVFPFDTASAAYTTVAADIDWQQFFQDARLKQLIRLALENNRDLRVAVLNIEQARAQLQIRRADEVPTIGIGASATRQPAPNGGISSLYTAGFSVTGYELDFFGRVRSLGTAAQAQLLGTEEARKTVQISLVASVANTYLSLLGDDELLRVARDTLGSREESLKLTKLRLDQGVSSELDFRLAESLTEGARVALAQTARQRALDENALVLLLGQPLPAETAAALPAGLPLTSQGLLDNLPAGVPSELLARRPDVRQAEQQLLAANANIGAARAAFFPRITLTGSVGSASTELGKLFHSGSYGWTFAPQLILPIFDGGRNQANLDASKISRDITVAQYEKAIQSAFREVADALASRSTLSEQLRAQSAQTAAEETRLRLTDLRYRNGAANYFEVLDAQRSVFAARQAVVQLQLQQTQNLVSLYKVLGGGWKDAPTTPP